jgi:cobyrinic acid a,c-diamide synthase
MVITCQIAARRLSDYLQHNITAAQLVDWAEMAMMDEELEEEHHELLRDIISRIGLADVRAFGLTWEDCQDFLSRLGYEVSVTVAEAPAGRCG